MQWAEAVGGQGSRLVTGPADTRAVRVLVGCLARNQSAEDAL